MTPLDSIGSYLGLMESQFAAASPALLQLSSSALWLRPAVHEWSAGEHVSHMARVHRSFRRTYSMLWPVSSLIARARSSLRPQTSIDDVYARPGFPHWVGRLWPPRGDRRDPQSAASLADSLRKEHDRLRTFFETRDETLLAQAPLYFPYLGWVSYVQCLRIGVYHDAHHLALARAACGLDPVHTTDAHP